MRLPLFRTILFSLLLISSNAHAQETTLNGNPAEFDQYPSFFQVTSHPAGTSEVVLRCGYSQSGGAITPDSSYMETSLINQNPQTYLRYQRIDNKIILTTLAPGNTGRFLMQVTEPNGIVAAKNCLFDPNTDSIQNCTLAQPFAPAAEATNQDQLAAQQCGTFFAKAQNQLATTTYDAQKTLLFKNTLRQKVNMIEAPQ